MKKYAEKICQQCGKAWTPRNYWHSRNLTCSWRCGHAMVGMKKRRRVSVSCVVCSTAFTRLPARSKKTCSRKCGNKYRGSKHLGKIRPLATRLKISAVHKGKTITKEQRQKMSAGHQGIPFSEWKEYITPQNQLIRESRTYKDWVVAILKRDRYYCRLCRSRKNLEAHHIYPFRAFPDKRFDVDNGITLCRPCHRPFTYREMEYANELTFIASLPLVVWPQDLNPKYARMAKERIEMGDTRTGRKKDLPKGLFRL